MTWQFSSLDIFDMHVSFCVYDGGKGRYPLEDVSGGKTERKTKTLRRTSQPSKHESIQDKVSNLFIISIKYLEGEGIKWRL